MPQGAPRHPIRAGIGIVSTVPTLFGRPSTGSGTGGWNRPAIQPAKRPFDRLGDRMADPDCRPATEFLHAG